MVRGGLTAFTMADQSAKAAKMLTEAIISESALPQPDIHLKRIARRVVDILATVVFVILQSYGGYRVARETFGPAPWLLGFLLGDMLVVATVLLLLYSGRAAFRWVSRL
jgi:hypothetical protein